MSPVAKYTAFILILIAATYAAITLAPAAAGPVRKHAGTAFIHDAPPISERPFHLRGGMSGAVAIDHRAEDNTTAVGGGDTVKLWQLPAERHVAEIGLSEGFQVLQVRFLKGTGAMAVSGRNADDTGSIKMFSVASGKPVMRIDDPEPVLYMDYHPTGRYLVATGVSYLKVWDLVEGKAVSVVSKSNPESRGVFFMDGRYILRTDSLSLYNWVDRRTEGVLDAPGPVMFRKINDNLYAWLSGRGLSLLRTPSGRREFIPLSTSGMYAFDMAPDGKWGLFLNEDRTMAAIDCATGAIVKTVRLGSSPADILISTDASCAYVVYRSGDIEIFDIGGKNTLRKLRFYAMKMLYAAVEKISRLRGGNYAKSKIEEN